MAREKEARKRKAGERGKRAKEPESQNGDRKRRAARRKLRRQAGELVDIGLMKALSHESRVLVLATLTQGIASPKAIAEEIDEGLSEVSYHIKVLLEHGLIKLDRTEPRRGAVEHFYATVHPTLIPQGAWARLPGSLKQRVSVAILEELFEDAAASVNAGAFNRREGFHVSLTPLVLDEEALKRLSAVLERTMTELDAIQAEASKRLEQQGKDDEGGISFTVGVTSFESTRSPAEGRKAQTRKRC